MADVEEGSVSFNFKASAENASQQVQKLTNNLGKLNNVVSALKVGAWVAGIGAIGKSAMNFISKANDMINANNMFKISVGEVSDKTQEFFDKAEKLTKLDPTKTMNAFASFSRILTGFQLPKDEVDLMSRNLTQLTADLSATGLTWDNAMQKVKSGISGEIEPMRAIGVALDQNTLQQTANTLGIKQRVSEMTRAQKTELLYYQMMKSTANIQGTMAKTIMSPTQALRMMKTEMLALARDIGTVLIPIFLKVIPVVRAVIQVIGEAVRWIAKLFGVDLKQFVIQTQDIDDNIGGVDNGIDNIGKTAKKTKKELDKMLMPFDELNNVKFDTGDTSGSGSSSGSTGVGGSLGLDLPEYDMFKGLSEDINNQVDQIKNKIKEMLPLIITIAGLSATIFTGLKIADFVMWLSKVVTAFKELMPFVDKIKTVSGIFLTIGGALLYVKGIFDILNPQVNFLKGVLEALARSCIGSRWNFIDTTGNNSSSCSRDSRSSRNTRGNNMEI